MSQRNTRKLLINMVCNLKETREAQVRWIECGEAGNIFIIDLDVENEGTVWRCHIKAKSADQAKERVAKVVSNKMEDPDEHLILVTIHDKTTGVQVPDLN